MMINESTQQNDTPRRTRRHAALGVTAGVLGGGAIGMLMVAPSLTSAAPEDGTAIVEVAAITDDTTGETDDTTDDTTGRPERGVHLREMLQGLVDDGTISAEQADAVADHLIEHRPERGDMKIQRRGSGEPGGRGGHLGVGVDTVADLLGIDAETLRTELRAGSSLADLATANGVEVQAVVDALLAPMSERLDEAVENGRLTDEEAADRLSDITERITARVDGERPTRD